MSRGRKAKTASISLTWEEIFNKSQGFYFQYLITQLGRKNTKLSEDNADDLLETIKQEKEKLVKDKKIRQGKLQEAAIQEDLFFEIPENWVWCKLDEISSNITDGTHQTPRYTNEGRPFISAQHVKPFRFIPFNYKFVSEEAYQENIKNSKPELGDILVTRVGAIGEAAVIDVELDFAFYVSVGLIKPFKDYVYPEFLMYVINSPYGNLYSKGNVSSKGSSAGNFNLGRIRSFLIPLPPRSEQKLILDFLQDLGNESIDEDREYFDSEIENEVLSILQGEIHHNQITTELSHQLELVSQLRQAFLREAMQGKLVPQDGQDEPAEILLEKIKAEKQKLIAEKKIKKQKPLPEIKPEEIPFEIPNNWTWCRLGEICEKIGSGSTPRGSNYAKSGIPFFRSQNVYNEGLVLNDITFISDEVHKKMDGTKVIANDILLNITGGSLGRAALVPNDLTEGNVSQHVCIVRPIQVDNSFLHKLALSPFFQYLVFNSTTGAGREGLPKNNLEQFTIPLPPLAEQKRIVEKLERLMNFCDELESNIRQSATQAETLLQVALKEALEPK